MKNVCIDDLKEAVQNAGLTWRDCGNGHLQIVGGENAVNMWPFTKNGFRFQVSGQKSRGGNIAEAIRAAGKPVSKSAAIPQVFENVQWGVGPRIEYVAGPVSSGITLGVVLWLMTLSAVCGSFATAAFLFPK